MNPRSTDPSPRPRILFQDLPDEVFEELRELAPTNSRISAGDGFHRSDWDLIVSFGDPVPPLADYHILSFGGLSVRGYFGGSNELFEIVRNEGTKARSTYVADSCPPGLRAIAQRSLVDHERSDGSTRVMWDGRKPEGSWSIKNVPQLTTPLVQVGDEGYVHSFIAHHGPFGQVPTSQIWMLPRKPADYKAWLQAMIEALQAVEPDRFPTGTAWQLTEEWAPPELVAALRDEANIAIERSQLLADLDSRMEAAAAKTAESALSAAEGLQQLLTANGPALVNAVANALTRLGFAVEDMDGHHDLKSGAKLEDLRAIDPETDDWVALVEVKGYLRGAKVTDVPQITGRPTTSFALEAGREPSAVWHIVNHWRETDPSTRPVAIDNDRVNLRPLVEADGCLIDSRDLFKAVRATESGLVEAADVRRQLRESRGRWTYSQASP